MALREIVRPVLQEILEAGMTDALGAAKSERTAARLGCRAGYHGRTLITRVGKLELRVPQDRDGRLSIPAARAPPGRSGDRRPAPAPGPDHRPSPATAANQRWCIDFKGWFRTRDGQRCDPLTLTDAASRYLLALEIVPPTSGPVEAAVDRLLQEHGLPERLLMDNGPPFAASGAGGLTRLSVKWLKLGIALERITPGRPQENGRHERMHRTLKAETSCPPAASRGEQQTRFDAFREDFNHHRPHEALGQRPPASVWRASPRPYPAKLEEPWYDAEHAVRRVRSDGGIKWAGTQVFVSEALVGEPVGIAELDDGSWLVRFASLDLGLIDRRSRKLTRFTAARPGRREGEPIGNDVNHVPGSDCQP